MGVWGFEDVRDKIYCLLLKNFNSLFTLILRTICPGCIFILNVHGPCGGQKRVSVPWGRSYRWL